MLFNSPYYIFVFLPIILFVYFLLNKLRYIQLAKAWLVIASLYFYGYWNPSYLILIITSVLLNFKIGSALHKTKRGELKGTISRKSILMTGIVLNLSVLAYYKYSDFFIENFNSLVGIEYTPLNLVLPLAISFFTFQQVAYLVDCYQFDTQEYDFLNYCLFVTFFPQLIAGPIVHHKEMMPQFSRLKNTFLNYNNMAKGLFIFSLGLFKKIAIADTFATWVGIGFDNNIAPTFLDAWGVSLSYTFQLYYDFSGYSDMAIGAALFFNIYLPINFNSPYKALSIQDFWRRWHMTLSQWLRDYLYIPLGGNRRGATRNTLNLIITFLLGGLWHGAGWTFILWGALHGIALVIHRIWQNIGFKLPNAIAWFLTFLFINFTWVFFRAKDIDSALQIIAGMCGLNGFNLSNGFVRLVQYLWGINLEGIANSGTEMLTTIGTLQFIIIFGGLAFFGKNSLEIGLHKLRFDLKDAVIVVCSLALTIFLSIATSDSVFLYFNF